MATMGRYCKAYPIAQFRAFPGWREQLDHLAPAEAIGDDPPQPRTQLAEDDYLFLQETYCVTDGIFQDEYVIFDLVTPEWKVFCADVLAFALPDDAAPDDAAPAPG
jgi:hypothetical protein